MPNRTYLEISYEINVFNVLLFLASNKGKLSLPNGEKPLLVTMAAAVVEYLVPGSGESVLFLGGHFFSENTRSFNGRVEQAFEQTGVKMNPALLEVLKGFLKVEWEHDHGESWWESGLKGCLGELQRGLGGTFCLTVPFVEKAKAALETSLDSGTAQHCTQIGATMRAFIDRAREQSLIE